MTTIGEPEKWRRYEPPDREPAPPEEPMQEPVKVPETEPERVDA